MEPYAPRPIHFHGIRAAGDGWRIKLYSIRYGERALDWPALEEGIALALERLPSPARAPGRPGVGFVIAHQGRGADYVVLGWWDRENELPVTVTIRDRAPDGRAGAWRPARDGESFCVWDLQVIAAERDAYVATVLSGPDAGGAPSVEAYLARAAECAASPEAAALS